MGIATIPFRRGLTVEAGRDLERAPGAVSGRFQRPELLLERLPRDDRILTRVELVNGLLQLVELLVNASTPTW